MSLILLALQDPTPSRSYACVSFSPFGFYGCRCFFSSSSRRRLSLSLFFFFALSSAGETQAVLQSMVPLVFFLAALLVFDPFDNLRTYTKAYLLHLFCFCLSRSLSLSLYFSVSSSLRPLRCACGRDKQGAACQTAPPMTVMAVYVLGLRRTASRTAPTSSRSPLE